MRSDQLLAIRAKKLAKGLLEIAYVSMPSTFFKTDSRCVHARETLAMFNRNKKESAERRRQSNKQKQEKNHGSQT